ncbi:uncharacterized protein [Nicotiana tomentosiformis]|uniref:uncharacterized protein n=1 Tax=Nicotiana tomentosiformis TaxID=4098 RepID=UPI00388C81E8
MGEETKVFSHRRSLLLIEGWIVAEVADLCRRKSAGSRESTYPRLSDYNFNVILVELVSVMRNIKKSRFPKPILSDPSQRDPNLWCEFYGTHSHMTGDCRHLRDEVATLLKNGHLRDFLSIRAKSNYGKNQDVAEPSKPATGSPRMMQNMIFGGDKVNGVTSLAAKKINILVTHGKRIREVSEDDITFTKEDTDGLLLSHDDALVISLNVLDFKIKCELVYLGSSANIIQWRVLEQAKLIENIVPTTKLLAGFNITSVKTQGEILLPTYDEGVTKTTLFEVVEGDMGYNVILGRPWIHEMKVVPSTYHQMLKFPTLERIKHIRGDQPTTREMNTVTVSSRKGKETSK